MVIGLNEIRFMEQQKNREVRVYAKYDREPLWLERREQGAYGRR